MRIQTKLTTRIKGYGRKDKVRLMKGPWHGGADNAKGPYGGPAPANMIIEMAYKIHPYKEENNGN
jgi:hypothetical protein